MPLPGPLAGGRARNILWRKDLPGSPRSRRRRNASGMRKRRPNPEAGHAIAIDNIATVAIVAGMPASARRRRRAAAAAARDLPHPAGAGRRRPPRLRDHPGRRPRAPAARCSSAPGTLYRSIQRMLEQGLIVETARAAGARAGRRAAPLLPDHAVRQPRWRGPRPRACTQLVRLARASGPRAGAGLMRALPRAPAPAARPRSAREYGDEMCARLRAAPRATRTGRVASARALDRRRSLDVAGMRRARAPRPPAPGPALRRRAAWRRARVSRSPRWRWPRSASAPPPPPSRSPTTCCSGRCPSRTRSAWCSSGRRSAPRLRRASSCRRPTTATGRRRSTSFEAMGAFRSGGSVNLVGEGDPERLDGAPRSRPTLLAAPRRAAAARPALRRRRRPRGRAGHAAAELRAVAAPLRRRSGAWSAASCCSTTSRTR